MEGTAGTIRTHRGMLFLKMRIVEGEAACSLQRMQQTVSSLHKKFCCLAGWKKRMVKRRRSLLAAHKTHQFVLEDGNMGYIRRQTTHNLLCRRKPWTMKS